jgi:uncharacterized protein YbaR (Trm112 family)
MSDSLPIPADLLEILRCPVGVHSTEHGDDPGQLRLAHGCWLICDQNGYKYPIVEGIPNMLPEVGKKWSQTQESDLPVPPPADFE